MHVLVTGGAGHLGRAVGEALLSAGHEVRGADKVWRDTPFPLELVDLLEPFGAYRLAEGCDAVVHLANHPHMRGGVLGQQTYTDNVTLDLNVFQAACDRGIRNVVFSSSIQAITGTRGGMDDVDQPSGLAYLPLDGDVPPRPGNLYALSKIHGEQQLRYLADMVEGLSATAIRFPWIMDERHMHWMRRRSGDAGRWFGNIDEVFSYLAQPDAASLVVAILQRPRPGYRCLLPAAPDNLLGQPIPEVIARFYPNVPLRTAADAMEALVDIAAITAAYDWRPEQTGLFE